MKRYLLLPALAFLLFAFVTSPEESELVFEAPADWQREQIPFPLGFAPDLKYDGFEDLCFAPGWSDTSSAECWTYTFAWYVEPGDSLDENRLSKEVTTYFDGLMRIDSKDRKPHLDSGIGVFLKNEGEYFGKVRTYDNFFRKTYMTLHIRVRESYCEASDKRLIWFRLSPKPFSHPVWKIFEAIRIVAPCC